MEATSIYHELLAKYLFDAGYQVCVTNPARARYFAQSMSKLNKTDKVDSEVLARFTLTADPTFLATFTQTYSIAECFAG